MNRGKDQSAALMGGYTIVEVLIFLAISALLFFMAMMFVGGQVNRTEFTETVRDFETHLSDVANNVATGYYQSANNVECTKDPVSHQPRFANAANQQGTNGDCIFIGTVIKLGHGGAGGDTSFDQFTVTGIRAAANGESVRSLGAANPKALFAYNDDSSQQISNVVLNSPFLHGARVVCAKVGSTTCNPASDTNTNMAIGFFTDLSQASPQEGGTVRTLLIPFANTQLNADPTNTAASISSGNLFGIPGTNYATVPVNPNGGVTICIASGGTRQYALIHVGAGGASAITVSNEIKSYSGASPTCV